MTEPDIRPAKLADLPGILALYRQLNPDDPVLELAAAEPVWTALLASGLTTPYVIDRGGLLVASCTLAIIPNLSRGARRYGVIENVVTHADHCRTGLGKAVLEVAMAKAWKTDCYKILLTTGRRDEATLKFYEGMGFQRGAKTYFEMRRS